MSSLVNDPRSMSPGTSMTSPVPTGEHTLPPGQAAQRKRKRTSITATTAFATQNAGLPPKSVAVTPPGGSSGVLPPTTAPGPSPSKGDSVSLAKARPDLPHFMGYDNQRYRCICGTTIEPEEGSSMQCESCLAWQHAGCFGLTEADLEGVAYFCELCSHRPFTKNEPYIAYCRALEQRILSEAQPSEAPEVAATSAVPGKKSRTGSSGGRGRGKARTESASGSARQNIVPPEQTESTVPPSLDSPINSGEVREHPEAVAAAVTATVSAGMTPQAKPTRKKTITARGGKAKSVTRETPATSRTVPTPERATREQSIPPTVVTEHQPPLRMLEYTLIERFLFRGKRTQREMRGFLEEWVTSEEKREVENAVDQPDLQQHGIEQVEKSEDKSTVMMESEPIEAPPKPNINATGIENPDFELLGSFIPPVSMSGSDLKALACPTYVKDADSGYQFPTLSSLLLVPDDEEGVPSFQNRRDPKFSVHTATTLSPGDFLGPLYGEVYRAEDYQQDPINQYFVLGLPKAKVRRVGPPINIVIDARCYGNDLRFIRSGCAPNAVIRPVLFRSEIEDEETVEMAFGVFACTEIQRGEELVLGWEWDDQHMLHAIKDALAVKANSGADSIARVGSGFQRKIAVIASHFLNNFDACACNDLSECAIARMLRLAFGERAIPELADKGGKKLRRALMDSRAGMGPLIGVRRNWRHAEVEKVKLERDQTNIVGMLWQMFQPMVEPYLGGLSQPEDVMAPDVSLWLTLFTLTYADTAPFLCIFSKARSDPSRGFCSTC